jgi:hypothetical protein
MCQSGFGHAGKRYSPGNEKPPVAVGRGRRKLRLEADYISQYFIV